MEKLYTEKISLLFRDIRATALRELSRRRVDVTITDHGVNFGENEAKKKVRALQMMWIPIRCVSEWGIAIE